MSAGVGTGGGGDWRVEGGGGGRLERRGWTEVPAMNGNNITLTYVEKMPV